VYFLVVLRWPVSSRVSFHIRQLVSLNHNVVEKVGYRKGLDLSCKVDAVVHVRNGLPRADLFLCCR
jgi:hypothetical protein